VNLSCFVLRVGLFSNGSRPPKIMDGFQYLDSDSLPYCNATDEFRNIEFTVCNGNGPEYTFFTGHEALNEFCDYILKLYREDRLFERLLSMYKLHIENNHSGGVSDMSAFHEYGSSGKDKRLGYHRG
jgi:hypothetical protein